jgi:hypothetical protein
MITLRQVSVIVSIRLFLLKSNTGLQSSILSIEIASCYLISKGFGRALTKSSSYIMQVSLGSRVTSLSDQMQGPVTDVTSVFKQWRQAYLERHSNIIWH